MSSTISDDVSVPFELPQCGTLRNWALRQFGQRLRFGTLTLQSIRLE